MKLRTDTIGLRDLNDSETVEWKIRHILAIWFKSSIQELKIKDWNVEKVVDGYRVFVAAEIQREDVAKGTLPSDTKTVSNTFFISTKLLDGLDVLEGHINIHNTRDINRYRSTTDIWSNLVEAWCKRKLYSGEQASFLTYRKYFAMIDAPIRILK